MVLALLTAIVIGLFISSDISKPLIKMKELAQNLAKFDFTHNYGVKRKDEFGEKISSIIVAQENIKERIRKIIENSHDMNSSCEELAASAEKL